jgi:cell wall-associated NlpC family hydrolase
MLISLRALTVLFLLLLSGCASQRDLSVDPQQANAVVFSAMQQVGKPYRYGGDSPQTGFDCSGLVNYVFRSSVGINLPRSSRELKAMNAPTIDEDDVQTGDIVIFATGLGFTPDHAGIYVGNGRFVHSPSRGGKVRLDNLAADYWQRSFLTAKRPLAGRRWFQPNHSLIFLRVFSFTSSEI